MDEKIDVKQTLRVFNIITRDGERSNGDYCFNGIVASAGFDGYTISLSNDYVQLDIFFHNTFSIEATNKKEKIAFLEKLAAIDK